jgi:hypothetical protein
MLLIKLSNVVDKKSLILYSAINSAYKREDYELDKTEIFDDLWIEPSGPSGFQKKTR